MTKTFPGRLVFHVDMDAFFASVEQLEIPSLRGKPVIVGGVDSQRGVVSSASYEARVFGIHSAMPVAQARRRCPHGIYVQGRHGLYLEYSRRLMDCLSEFTPALEQVSVDEAFLEMTGTDGIFGEAEESGQRIRGAIRERLSLTASLGAAENKFLAKLASDANKPDGMKVVKPGEAQAFLDPMPVGRLWGVGKKTAQALNQLGLYTIAQLRSYPMPSLEDSFGANFARHLHALAHGTDQRELTLDSVEKSISHERTFEVDCSHAETLTEALLEQSERVARRARLEGLAGRTVSLVWRNPDFTRQSHSRSLPEPVNASDVIYRTAKDLLAEVAKPGQGAPRRFRLIGVRLSNFAESPQQQDLFQAPASRPKIDIAMDAVRNRFGEDAIRRARLSARDGEG